VLKCGRLGSGVRGLKLRPRFTDIGVYELAALLIFREKGIEATGREKGKPYLFVFFYI
jgi:hypothetical protein